MNAFNHFLSHKDEVGAVYTDNSREFIATIGELGYRHQTSTEYVDSSKSFVEREIRHMLEGTRTNLVQSGLPLQYWPMAMQHFSMAVNATPQLNGDDAPWKLRFDGDFPGQSIPFGAKLLFWNNPKRVDNTSGKTSPTANDGIFLGYHIQPGFAWKGEYLVAKLEALDYHAETGSITVQRARRVELIAGGFVFPLRALKEAKEPKPDRLADNVIADPRPIPFQSELQTEEHAEASEEAIDKSSEAVLDALASADQPAEEPVFPDIKYTPTGKPIPDGYHWDGTRLVKTYKGSKRPESIPSDLWKMLSPKDRQKLVEEEAEKMAVGSGGAASSSASKVPKKKKGAVATARKLRVNPSPSGEPTVSQWEVIPKDRPKFCVPAMPKAVPAKAELHRPELREMIKNKIAELEFKVALELFSAVARLVPKDEVRRNPKAKAALDKEWENLRTKGVWDESRVKECKSIVEEARKKGETVHLGRIFEACYEKGSELPADDPRRKFKGRTVFQGNNVRDQDSDHALFAELGSSPASMEAAKLLDAFGSQPGFSKAQADAIQAYIQALFTGVPTWLSLPRNRWPEHWEKQFWQPMVPLVLALYGHPDSGGIWENHLNSKIEKKVGNKFFLMFGKVFSIMLSTIACWLFTWMISNSQVLLRTWKKHGLASKEQSTLVTLNLNEKLILLHIFLTLRRLLQHGPNIGQLIFGNMTPSTKLGQGIISSHGRSCSSLAMRGGSLPSLCIQNGLQCSTKMLNLRVSRFSTCTCQMKVQLLLKTT